MPKVLGREKLHERLLSLQKGMTQSMTDALVAEADDIVRQMKHHLDDDKELQEATDWKFGGPPAGPSGVIGRAKGSPSDDQSDTLRITIFSGSFKAFWARWREFGTMAHSLAKGASRKQGKLQDKGPHHPGERARPYFFPVWRANLKTAKHNITVAVNKAIKKIATSAP